MRDAQANLQSVLDRTLAPVRVPLGADVELRVCAIVNEGGRPGIEAALWRVSPGDPSREFVRTGVGWRIPAHLVPLAAEALLKVGKRAAEADLWRAP